MNNQDIINAFKATMTAFSIEAPECIIADGILHRFKIAGKLTGAYKLHLDGVPAGFFQDFRQGIKENWKFNGEVREYSPEERRAYAQNMAAQERQRQAEETAKHLNAANVADIMWKKAKPATEHPYLSKKRIQPHAARILNNALVLPLYAENLRLMSLEFIDAEGNKRFLKGGKKAGCFWWIGKQTEKILIAEGYATAATLHECTGLQVFIAFDAGNLIKVAQIVRAKRPQAEIVICADNDASGTGQREAEKAALAVGGLVAIPPEIGDYNDLIVNEIKDGAA